MKYSSGHQPKQLVGGTGTTERLGRVQEIKNRTEQGQGGYCRVLAQAF